MKQFGFDGPTFVARRSLPSERLGACDPAFVRRVAEMVVARQMPEMVAGIRMDPAVRQLGHDDAGKGHFRLSVEDIQRGRNDNYVLAYFSGWIERKQADKRRGG